MVLLAANDNCWQDSIFLQQACHITDGVYWRVSHTQKALLQYFLVATGLVLALSSSCADRFLAWSGDSLYTAGSSCMPLICVIVTLGFAGWMDSCHNQKRLICGLCALIERNLWSLQMFALCACQVSIHAPCFVALLGVLLFQSSRKRCPIVRLAGMMLLIECASCIECVYDCRVEFQQPWNK